METNSSELGGAIVCTEICAEETRYGTHRHYVAFARADHVRQESFYCLKKYIIKLRNDRGNCRNLLLRHSVPRFLFLSFRGIAFGMLEFNAELT